MMGRVRRTKTNEVTVSIDNKTNKSRNEMCYMKDDAMRFIRMVESVELPTLKMNTYDNET